MQLLLKVLFFVGSITMLYSEPMVIMPLGDSITYGTGETAKSTDTGYRAPLWYKLKDENLEVDFVGSLTTGEGATPPFDMNHEGHPGWTSHDIANKLYGYLQNANPTIILLHIGTNDHSQSVAGVESILNTVDRYENATGRYIRIMVAKIINRSQNDPTIAAFNHNLGIIVQKRWQLGDKLTLVDMSQAGLTEDDYVNNTHPNNNGYTKMANVWFAALSKAYIPFTTAPFTEDDKVAVNTGNTVSINVLANDKDYQDDMNLASINFVGGTSTLTVSGEGVWNADKNGIVTFTPNSDFTADPTPVAYTVKDQEGTESQPATITIDYTNSSLESYPTSIVDKSYIESTSIDEVSNSIEFITRVPSTGISF